MPSWYLISDPQPLSASRNMAVDEFLFQCCHNRKTGFLRLYSWQKPTFSFGVSQRISKVIDLAYIEKNHFDYVRRITGGKTVLHDKEITYSLISSEDIFFLDNDLFKSYLLISKVLQNAFLKLGIPAELSSNHSAELARSDSPCFSFPTPSELEIEGKKIVGSAQKRNRKALLQHGSIPLGMDYIRYAEGANSRPEILRRSMTTLNEFADFKADDLRQSIISSFEEFLKVPFKEYTYKEDEEVAIKKLEQKYSSRDWNFLH